MSVQTIRYWYQYHFRITVTGQYNDHEFLIEEFDLPGKPETIKEPDWYIRHDSDFPTISSAAAKAEKVIDLAIQIRRDKVEEAKQLQALKPKLAELKIELDLPDISDEKALKILNLIKQKQVENDDECDND